MEEATATSGRWGALGRCRTCSQPGAAWCLLLLCALDPARAHCQQARPSASSKTAAGERIFESRCSACHGLDGAGGEHAPGIARDSAAAALSDSTLAGIIHNGIPAKGMPDFRSLGDSQISAVVAYLRQLQGRSDSQAVTGDPARGERLFFGKAACADCHVMRGRGRFVASDLSDFARHHTPGEIRDAIVLPRSPEQPPESVKIVSRDGRSLSGVVRNEDNFSIQVQDADGGYHLLEKSDAATMVRAPAPAMPRDYATRLNASELNDLVTFIVRAAPGEKNTSAQDEGSRAQKH